MPTKSKTRCDGCAYMCFNIEPFAHFISCDMSFAIMSLRAPYYLHVHTEVLVLPQ